LSDFESAAFAEDDVRDWDTDVFVDVFAVAFGGLVVAHDCQVSYLCDTWGVCWDDDCGVAIPLKRSLVMVFEKEGGYGKRETGEMYFVGVFWIGTAR
jgi:hypothetical protein